MTPTIPNRPAPIVWALRNCAFTELRRLDAIETDGEVVITGVVRSYFLKQMAQETVRPALGGRRLRNRLVVVSERRAVD
jgi:hypothetical protein